jgi:hypothetical protein
MQDFNMTAYGKLIDKGLDYVLQPIFQKGLSVEFSYSLKE